MRCRAGRNDGAGNGETLKIVRGKAGLHVATLLEPPARGLFHVGWELLYE
jgi:hypothetical protein